jgi:hypothetical protein
MATIFGVLVGEANIKFKPGLVDAHGGQVSPVNSSYKDNRGVCATKLSPIKTMQIESTFFFINLMYF